HATSMPVNLLPGIEDAGMLKDQIASMTLLATCLNVIFSIQRPEPKLVPPVSLCDRGCCHTVSIVAWSTAKPLRIMNLQDFFGGMADKNLFANILLRDGDWLTGAEVARFASIYQIYLFHVDLLDLDIKMLHLASETNNLLFSDPCKMLF